MKQVIVKAKKETENVKTKVTFEGQELMYHHYYTNNKDSSFI